MLKMLLLAAGTFTNDEIINMETMAIKYAVEEKNPKSNFRVLREMRNCRKNNFVVTNYNPTKSKKIFLIKIGSKWRNPLLVPKIEISILEKMDDGKIRNRHFNTWNWIAIFDFRARYLILKISKFIIFLRI